MTEIETIANLLEAHDKEVAVCPADKRSLGDKDCPKCGASSAGPCWVKVSADSTFVDIARQALSAIKGDKS